MSEETTKSDVMILLGKFNIPFGYVWMYPSKSTIFKKPFYITNKSLVDLITKHFI